MLDRILGEIDRIIGGERRGETGRDGEGGEIMGVQPSRSPPVTPRPSPLAERRAELDRGLRAELERQGLVVNGTDIARVVSAAAGKSIAWAG
jgi:hypothetical protein